MYSDPPPSQLRRPWSSETPLAPLRNTNDFHQSFQHDDDDVHDPYTNYASHTYYRNQREPSDVSVDALDLADYAATLRLQYQNPAETRYPPSPSLPPPPSLVSRGNTCLSSSAAFSSRRPFSLPPPSTAHGQGAPSEIDIGRFPPWTRNWFKSAAKDSDDLPAFLSNGHNPDYFDPGYNAWRGGTSGHTENSLPWSPYEQDPPSYHGHSSMNGGIDMETKQARIRLLEREFAHNTSSKQTQDNAFLDHNGKPLVGTVDEKGNLVTQGPKKRMATRIAQILLALCAAIPSIYAALAIKPSPAAPPAMKPPALALYALSVITSVFLLYLFLFRPCCCGPRRKGNGIGAANPLGNGMMVLPIPDMPGAKKKQKAGGRHKKGKGGNMIGSPGGDVQVNLIVDPGMFNNGGQSDSDKEYESDIAYREGGVDNELGIPGAYYSGDSGCTKRKRRRGKRRSVFAGLAMEAEWKRARSWLKKIIAVDVVCLLIWGILFVLIMMGKRCPSGGFDGWCNAYNVSTAATCLLCVAFGVAIFFDVKDLNTSKVSPRTRA